MQNFSSLASLEVPEKLVVVEHVATVSNPTKLLLSCFELSCVGFRQLPHVINNDFVLHICRTSVNPAGHPHNLL